jgi:hypothetical protein
MLENNLSAIYAFIKNETAGRSAKDKKLSRKYQIQFQR